MEKINNQNKNWYMFDAKDYVLGRLSTEIANILRGKNKSSFKPNIDCGDYVVVVNSEKINLSGNKEEQKRYYKHTGYIGNLKTKTVADLREKNPEEIILHAVSGMMPKNKLSAQLIKRLKVYRGANHPHQNIKFKNQELNK